MAQPKRGDVWIVDLGLAAKVRPCLLLTDFPTDDELALLTVVPHTTAIRGNKWEHVCEKNFLQHGAFHLQQVQSVSIAKLVRRLGALDDDEMARIAEAPRRRLALH
jgi:mRNA interferase MazF